MDRTVVSMEKIRTAVSNTSKRAKRLAESAQEVSQILAIVTGISEQANLLAFNASIEAARAGEQGQGFRQVSDEVRNLAAQVSEAAQDIERLVQSIQEETASVINVLEIGTSEVVNGTQLVHQTQKTLSHLTTLSQEIDTALQRVAANTTTQAETSQQVNQTMKSVAGVSLENAEAAREVVEVLQQLLREVSTLQASVNRFQV
jgi:twitching motility protein PilJ